MFVAACGGGGGGGTSSAPAASTTPAKGKQGGTLTYLTAGDVDYIDPGQTYYTFGYAVLYPTQRTLYSFKPQDSVHPVPDLATGPPEISADNKTITVHIKKGIKYSPPVNREVTTADIKYAFERAFTKQVPSGYAGTYFGSLVGAPSTPNTGDYKPISGLETPDKYTIVFTLSKPLAPEVSQALVMPITVPVPKEYAQKFDKHNPSTYDSHVVFTGPYMVKNDSSGKLVGRVPGKSIALVRNPNWDKSTDYRPAYLDAINIQEGNDDATVASRRVINGSAMICCDAGSPPAPVLKQVVTRNKGQILFVPSGGTRYFSFNNTIPPFNNVNVRKALIAGIDRNALRLTRGGAILGDIANGWIPPGIPGFDEAGGLKQNTDLDFFQHPSGDPALFAKYMGLAAKQGVPVKNGKYAGTEKLSMVGDNADPGKKTAEVLQGQLQALGFKVDLHLVPHDTMYTKFCQVPSAKIAICPNVGWFKDFTDPQSMLDATFNGNHILKVGNVNYMQFNDPAVNAAMDKAALLPIGKARNEAWAKINHMIAAQAAAVPWIWDKTALVNSKDVNAAANGYYTTHDLDFTSLK